MRKRLCKMCVWLAMAVCALSTQEVFSTQNNVEIKEELQIQESTFLVSPDNLYLDESDVLVNLNGLTYPVRSLERNGSQWAVTVFVDANYCPLGHLTCKNCGMCHKEKCRYYVRPCKLWE